ncbi:membrane protein insertion efficiency factor YidD [Neotabrizicola sp. VNH66]|uniref:membrane protein insertion efficiency factor YidD n=1 Tax=Neotabrizicola sp. VNH66 TaxID=3400918 RepID=UPI003C124208
MLSRGALLAIGAYQRHLSPRKGYACAYRVAHGGTGCSGFAKAAIAEAGLWRAIPAIRARFAACRDAAEELHNSPAGGESDTKRRRDSCDLTGCSGCDLPFRGCGRADDTPNCDCAPDGCGS